MIKYSIPIFMLLLTIRAYGAVTVPPDTKPKILLVYDFTGPGRVTSQLSALGADIAFDAYPKIKKQHELVRVDMGTDVKTVGERVSEAVKQYSPSAVFGAINSNHAFVISSIAEANGIPYVAPVATHVKLTEGKQYTFRACFDDSFQSAKLAEFIFKSRKRKRGIILFNETQTYATGVRDIVSKKMLEMGLETPALIPITSEKDVTPDLISKISALAPEYIVLPSYQIEAAAILSKLIEALPPSTEYFGTDSWGGGRMFDRIFESTGKSLKGFYSQHWSMESKSSSNLNFLKRLRSYPVPPDLKFDGTAMNSPIALGYDGMSLILEGISKKTKAQSLADSIKSIKISGASGEIDLRDGPTPKKGIFIFEITGRNEKFYQHYK